MMMYVVMRCDVYRYLELEIALSFRTSRKSHDGSHGASLTRMPIQIFVRLCCECQNRQRW